MSDLALDMDGTAVPFDNPFKNTKSKTGADIGGLGGKKRFKYLIHVFLLDTTASVRKG